MAPPGKARTITLIVSATVVVALLGGAAGVVFDGDTRTRSTPAESTGSDPAKVVPATSSNRNSRAGGGVPTEAPDDRLAMSLGSLFADDDDDDDDRKSRFTRIRYETKIWVPRRWDVVERDRDEISLCSPGYVCIYAYVRKIQPRPKASSIITQRLWNTVGQWPHFVDLAWYDSERLTPFGRIRSAAMQDYTAFWVDNQFSVPVYGRIFVLVRRNGVVLDLVVTAYGGTEYFDDELKAWYNVVRRTTNSFAGA